VNRFTDGVLVNSQAMKEDVLQRERISPDKVHIIYNGVDIQKYRMRNRNVELSSRLAQKKYELGIPETSPVIGIIANLFAYKGHRDFIIAASKVHQHYPEARFLCIGEDWGIQQHLEELRSQLGLQNHLIFTGSIPNVAEMLHVIDIQVSASYEEGFSNVILEGMASGKPIIATSVGGTPEAILDKRCGLLVPPKNPTALAEARISLLQNPDFAVQLGYNARKRVEEYFSMEKMLDKLENLYLTFIPL
jgi:glycosyltransferase involved in cell wall biosynthesis